MSEAATTLEQPPASRGLEELMRCVGVLLESVQTAPLTRAQLMQRWGLTDVKTFQRWCDDLNLRPFEGRGEHARYRMPAVLRAEAKGEKRNGGSGE